MLAKCLSMLSKYFLYDKYNLSILWSLHNFISKIFLVARKIFFSNLPLNWSFKLLILDIFLEAINMSSTYNNKYINKSSKSFLKCTHLLWSLLSIKVLNFLYHCPNDYFKLYNNFFNKHTWFYLPWTMKPSGWCI